MSLQNAPARSGLAPHLLDELVSGTVQPDPDWAGVTRVYQENARALTGRYGTRVVVSPIGAPGEVPPGIADLLGEVVVLNGALIPGGVDALRAQHPDALRALVSLEGVFRHELGHIEHSRAFSVRNATDEVVEATALLEEIRMEHQLARTRPGDVPWIRAAANALVVEAIGDGEITTKAAAARTALLTLGRVEAGTLQPDDVRALAWELDAILGRALLLELRRLCAEAITVDDGDLEALLAHAQHFVELVPDGPADDQAGEKGEGATDPHSVASVGEPVASGDRAETGAPPGRSSAAPDAGQTGDERAAPDQAGTQLRQLLADTLESAAGQALADLHASGQLVEHAAQVVERAKTPRGDGEMPAAEREPEEGDDLPLAPPPPARSTDGPDQGELRERALRAGGVGSNQTAPQPPATRPPTPEESIAKQTMITTFRRARFRARDTTARRRPTPPGTLRVRGLVQREAGAQAGSLDNHADLFEARLVRHNDQPTLAVGIIVDLSGSMRGTESVLASSLYAVAEAVRHAGGIVSAAAFGVAFVPFLGPGLAMQGVPELNAHLGTDFVPEALDYVAGASLLYTRRHVRHAIVLSDGRWQRPSDVAKRMCWLKEAGCVVGVIDIGPSAPVIKEASWCIRIDSVAELSRSLAKIFADAYAGAT